MPLKATGYISRLVGSLAFCTLAVVACLNPIGQYYISEPISLDGISGSELVKELSNHKGRDYWQDTLSQLLDRKRNRSVSYEAVNHAVALAHLGKVKEAIDILEDVEHNEPGEYATAANLGTVYELNGENKKALKWIKEGFERNKEGHSGSEWLHVKILETKLKLEKEADWLDQNTILNIGFDKEADAADLHTLDHLGQRRSLREIESALVYQLHERLEFIKPPEPVVADLLADLSSIFALTRGHEDSQAIYELARSYGTQRPIYLTPPKLPALAPPTETWSGQSVILTIVSLVGLLLVLAVLIRFVSSRHSIH